MTEGNLTHRDLARLLGVSETTVKSYRRKFPDCIPVASQGKPIRFTAEAAAVSLRIRDLFEMGMSVEEVRARLAAEFAWITPEAPARDARDDRDDAESAEPAAPPQPARVELPQDFTLAVSNLAKSMVGLTQQQNAILKRVQHIETLIAALSPASGDGDVPGTTGTPGTTTLQGRPAWLDEAQALAARFEALLGAVTGSEGGDTGHAASVAAPRAASAAPASPAPTTPEPPTAATSGGDTASSDAEAAATSAPSGGRVVPFPGGMAAPPSSVPDAPEAAFPAPQDPPRHLLALPLVVQSPQGEFLGVAGRARGRFCINDLKAMLAFAFQPPDHYVLRSEPTEEGGWWLTLEQPQAEAPYDVVLLVDESVTPRGNQVAVVRRYVANGVESHPTEIYGFLRAVQG
ncbi:MerR family transcriptional regulator [Nitratidesulfovibrio liaohensis]|uniref:Helix-turn-helix domain-containing protein n=1 Tax=Nitratidesulfovibrio liaohensis TaxID=2604158 RepID=A0ABY9R0B0_9BACT|nr:MerR family transcriptional regulator [Nitratidesulfovibrio liaohensis]WMW64428.1 helix-turn-helix domain-containing protein [Nitratidesulfovibrio liaohensis]